MSCATTGPPSLGGRESGLTFLEDVLTGLRGRPKQIPSKYFYDERGSILFDRICQLEEYYLTRTELDLMERFAPEMGEALGAGAMLVEFGSGSSVKTRYLLDCLKDPAAYVPVDISGEHLFKTSLELASDYPEIEILPVCADFTRPFALPRPSRAPARVSVYFPGSTIGNFVPDQAAAILRRIVDLCGAGGGLIIGIDLKKAVGDVEAAYNDRLGVTAQFNLNLLERINRELGADFDLSNFSHRAFYNPDEGRIEMHLVSRKSQSVRVGGESISFSPSDTICTEYSHKYTVDEFSTVAAAAGLTLEREWTDPGRQFAVLHFKIRG
ncbi:L-histidine N(alpha)-methyltransferase [Paludisphaera mucosa]|uniref:L-histidine N(Alpha)-methyltransferase n=1 Tax=Paludisphaera mucosa TaxID=3030827 RepID=A0ABT6F4V9_9BACT|nr:L-histidine N(alpha)-methyltransferase [Paludisphaera mucosa]